MKHCIIYQLLLLSALGWTTLAGCDTISPEAEDLDGMRIPSSFNFNTTQDVTIHLNALDIKAGQVTAQIFQGNPLDDGKLIQQVLVDAGSSHTTTLNIGPHVHDQLFVATIFPSGELSLLPVNLSNRSASIQLTPSSDTDADLPKSQSSAAATTVFNTGAITNDFESGTRAHYTSQCWFFKSASITSGEEAITGKHSLRTGAIINQNNGPQVSSPWINFDGSGSIEFLHTTDRPRTSGMMLLYPMDINNQLDFNHRLYSYNYRNNTAIESVSIPVPASLQGVHRLVWLFMGSNQAQRVTMDDISISGAYASDATDECKPTDGEPPLVEYPNYYPAQGVFGSLAFEDNWPAFGDYDMNDLVLDYNVTEITNYNNDIIRLEFTQVIRAIGGVHGSGFGIQFPFSPSVISSVQGQRLDTGMITTNPNGTEAGQDKAVVIFWDESNKHMSSFANVIPDGNITAADTLNITVEFASPVSRSQLGSAPYNPFIFIHGTRDGQTHGGRGYEIHMKGQKPTQLADESLFGTYNDITDPAKGMYYTSREQLNWAINIPVSFAYPISKVSILDTYVNYRTWAESGGSSYPTWYLDEPVNVVENNVYR